MHENKKPAKLAGFAIGFPETLPGGVVDIVGGLCDHLISLVRRLQTQEKYSIVGSVSRMRYLIKHLYRKLIT